MKTPDTCRELMDYVTAAEVARKHGNQFPALLAYTTALSIIHRADAADWAALVAAKSTNQFVDLIAYTTALSVIHRAPESDWPRSSRFGLICTWCG